MKYHFAAHYSSIFRFISVTFASRHKRFILRVSSYYSSLPAPACISQDIPMASSAADECCVTGPIKEPVEILSIGQASASLQSSNDLKLFFDGASLETYLSSSQSQDYSCRFMCVAKPAPYGLPKLIRKYRSICQRNSWRPLQLTTSMLSQIIDKHGFSSNIRELTSCYYTRNNDLEDSFCTPFKVSADGPWLGIAA